MESDTERPGPYIPDFIPGCRSVKWDLRESLFGRSDIIPLWIADMDYTASPEIIKAVRERTEKGFFGYTYIHDDLRAVVCDYCRRRREWSIDPDWLVFTPGVMPILYTAVRAFSQEDDGVIVQSPVYYPYFDAVGETGRKVLYNGLRCNTASGYEMDIENLHRL